MSSNHYSIEIENVGLAYELYMDKTMRFKEYVINKLKRLRHVEKAYETFWALNSINLHIGDGERVGIIGLNGAGKSTLLKVISGILKPTHGSLYVNGNIQPLIEVGAGFNPEFSGRENIYFNGYMLGFSKKQLRAKEQDIIDFADLGQFIDVPVKYYSTGMSVRLGFSMATCIEPEVLVVDEMLAAGDASFIAKAKSRINALLEQARIIVMVSHDIGLIRNIARRVIVLEKGGVVFDGPCEEGVKFYLDRVGAPDPAEVLLAEARAAQSAQLGEVSADEANVIM